MNLKPDELIRQVKDSPAITLPARLAPVADQIDRAVLHGLITYTSIASGLGVTLPALSKALKSARIRAKKIEEAGITHQSLRPSPAADRQAAPTTHHAPSFTSRFSSKPAETPDQVLERERQKNIEQKRNSNLSSS